MGFLDPGVKTARPVSRLPFTSERRHAVFARLLSKSNGKTLAASVLLSYHLTGGQKDPFQNNEGVILGD